MTFAVASNLVLVTTAVVLAVLLMAFAALTVAVAKRWAKLLVLAAGAAAIATLWVQRQELQRCVDDVIGTVEAGGPYRTCTIFGFEVDVTRPTGERP